MRSILFFIIIIQALFAKEYDQVLKQTESKYRQEKCWEFSNLIIDMPWDTAMGLAPNTYYINIEGHGAILAIVNKHDVDTTIAVGVSWGMCNSKVKSYRVHYYKKNSRGIWYEVDRKRPGIY